MSLQLIREIVKAMHKETIYQDHLLIIDIKILSLFKQLF